jgi:hypothetical protein
MNLGDGEFDVATEYRFFGDGMTVRMRYSITNTGNSVLSGQVLKLDFDAYQDPNTSVAYTDTDGAIGDYAVDYDTTTNVVTDSDNYVWVTDDREGGGVGVVKYVVGQAGSISPLVDLGDEFTSGGQGAGNDRAYLHYQTPAIAPGETIEYVVLAKIYLFSDDYDTFPNMTGWQEGTWTAILTAIGDNEMMHPTVALVGIDDPSRVVNWEASPLSSSEGLASTGSDSSASGLLAVSVIATLIAFVVRRRSRA